MLLNSILKSLPWIQYNPCFFLRFYQNLLTAVFFVYSDYDSLFVTGCWLFSTLYLICKYGAWLLQSANGWVQESLEDGQSHA